MSNKTAWLKAEMLAYTAATLPLAGHGMFLSLALVIFYLMILCCFLLMPVAAAFEPSNFGLGVKWPTNCAIAAGLYLIIFSYFH